MSTEGSLMAIEVSPKKNAASVRVRENIDDNACLEGRRYPFRRGTEVEIHDWDRDRDGCFVMLCSWSGRH